MTNAEKMDYLRLRRLEMHLQEIASEIFYHQGRSIRIDFGSAEKAQIVKELLRLNVPITTDGPTLLIG